MAPDLIHARTRREFRELCSDWGVLRMIEGAFEVEGFESIPVEERDDSGGMRRGLFDAYARGIDWADPSEVARAIRVFEEILSWGAEGNEYTEKALNRVRRVLEHDGYSLDAERRIRPVRAGALRRLPLEQLRDPAAIHEHLQRLQSSSDADPPLAISSAKALVEATCKHVLEELGEDYDDKADIPPLVRSVQKALKVHPEDIAPTAKGRESIVQTLSNLSQVVTGLAELRNEYGPDHGRTRASSGMQPRHAHLAVGAAQTYCQFLLETLRDRRTQAGPVKYGRDADTPSGPARGEGRTSRTKGCGWWDFEEGRVSEDWVVL